MSQSLAKVPVHIVFSTKHRKPFLQNTDLRDELFAYMATILKINVDSPVLMINGVADHIHALCLLSRKFAIMNVVEEMKTETSKWLKSKSTDLVNFSWQSGYGVFGVSESNIPQVRKYIQDQETHHRTMSFEYEFRKLCSRHKIELVEQYAWDSDRPCGPELGIRTVTPGDVARLVAAALAWG